jgi:hypothetical protein
MRSTADEFNREKYTIKPDLKRHELYKSNAKLYSGLINDLGSLLNKLNYLV